MVVQAVLLALSGLFIKKIGATYVGAVGGILTALGSPSLGVFTFLFAFLFGVFVDVFLFAFRVGASREGVNRDRLIIAMTVSTMLIAIISYSAFAIAPQFFPISAFSGYGFLLQRSIMLDILVVFMGPATGAVAGYASAYLWNKYLRNISV